MPGYGTPTDPTEEFRALGAARVRNALATGQWDAEKRAAARVWVETQDASNWQKAQAKRSPDAKSFGAKLRSVKWTRYVIPIAGAVVGLGMLLARTRF
jgi:hypothetical protein